MIVPDIAGPTARPSLQPRAWRRRLESIRPIGSLAFGFLAAGSLVVAGVGFGVLQRNDEIRLRHSLDIEVTLGDVLSSLQDAEIGQRGYLLTGDPMFLGPYEKAIAQLRPQLDQLARAVAGSARQTAAVTQLRELAQNKQDELAQTLEARRRGDLSDALGLVRTRAGNVLMDEVRRQIEAIDAEEDRLIAERGARERLVGLLLIGMTSGLIALMGLLAFAALREARRRATLARFLPPELASLLADGATELTTGDRRALAITFVDVRGSTALAEGLPPMAFARVLSAFRDRIAAAAHPTHGVVDKFIGDGALVVFGLTAPATAAKDALRFAEMLLVQVQTPTPGDPPLRIGIGIHFGEVFCGVLGDQTRREFTVLGDAVNVAARLEAACKDLDVQLIISEAVLFTAGEEPHRWRSLGRRVLPGRAGPVPIFTPDGEHHSAATYATSDPRSERIIEEGDVG